MFCKDKKYIRFDKPNQTTTTDLSESIRSMDKYLIIKNKWQNIINTVYLFILIHLLIL